MGAGLCRVDPPRVTVEPVTQIQPDTAEVLTALVTYPEPRGTLRNGKTRQSPSLPRSAKPPSPEAGGVACLQFPDGGYLKSCSKEMKYYFSHVL